MIAIQKGIMQLSNSFLGGRTAVTFRAIAPPTQSRTAPRQLTTCMAKKKGRIFDRNGSGIVDTVC